MLGSWVGEQSPPAWGGQLGVRWGQKTSWVTHQVFQNQEAYSSRFIYCNIIWKPFIWRPFTFFPSSLEGGHFSSHCRNSNSACKDCPHIPAKGGAHLPGVTIWDIPMVFSMTVFLAHSSRPLPWEELQEWSVAHSNSLKEIIL